MRLQSLIASEQHPEQPRVLVGNRHQRLVITDPFIGGRDPCCKPCSSLWLHTERRLQRGSSALDEQAAKVIVAAPGDAAEPGLAAGRVLPRDKTEPSGELAPCMDFPVNASVIVMTRDQTATLYPAVLGGSVSPGPC